MREGEEARRGGEGEEEERGDDGEVRGRETERQRQHQNKKAPKSS